MLLVMEWTVVMRGPMTTMTTRLGSRSWSAKEVMIPHVSCRLYLRRLPPSRWTRRSGHRKIYARRLPVCVVTTV